MTDIAGIRVITLFESDLDAVETLIRGGLPRDIKRRLNLFAGLLESADNEFNRLTSDINKYKKDTTKDIENNNLRIDITSISLYEYLYKNYNPFISMLDKNIFRDSSVFNNIYHTMVHLGINDISSLDSLIKKHKSFLNIYINKNIKSKHMASFIRIFLILENKEKYFEFSNNKEGKMSPESYECISEYLGKEIIDNLLKKYSVELFSD